MIIIILISIVIIIIICWVYTMINTTTMSVRALKIYNFIDF